VLKDEARNNVNVRHRNGRLLEPVYSGTAGVGDMLHNFVNTVKVEFSLC
jgi:hypothetical protein